MDKKTKDSGKEASFRIESQDMQGAWVECPGCGRRIKTKNIESHVKRVHHEKLRIDSGKKKNPFITVAIAAMLILSVSYLAYDIAFQEEPTGEASNNIPDNTPDSIPDNTPDSIPDNNIDEGQDNDVAWLDSYNPRFVVGSGDDNWWVEYPDIHPAPGSQVDHPQWVLDALINKPVVIFAHSDDCASCIQQKADFAPVLEEHGLEIAYFGLPTDGSDSRAYESYGAYDSDGGQWLIPLTVFVTYIQDGSGNLVVAWHSTEGATGEDWIRAYMEDAIFYHHSSPSS